MHVGFFNIRLSHPGNLETSEWFFHLLLDIFFALFECFLHDDFYDSLNKALELPSSQFLKTKPLLSSLFIKFNLLFDYPNKTLNFINYKLPSYLTNSNLQMEFYSNLKPVKHRKWSL